jgi:hypothetical protein
MTIQQRNQLIKGWFFIFVHSTKAMRKFHLYISLLLLASCRNTEYQVADTKISNQPSVSLRDKIGPGFDSLKKTAALIKDGDLVCRAGNDIISFSIANFSKKDKEYSHSGIAFKENGQVYIYHVYVGAENPTGVVMREALDSFCNPKKEKGYGVFRYDLSDEERTALHAVLREHYNNKMLFDKLFDLKTDSTQYCAEMIAKALYKVTAGRIQIPKTNISDQRIIDPGFKEVYVKNFDYIAIDNLYLNGFTHTIQRIKF